MAFSKASLNRMSEMWTSSTTIVIAILMILGNHVQNVFSNIAGALQ